LKHNTEITKAAIHRAHRVRQAKSRGPYWLEVVATTPQTVCPSRHTAGSKMSVIM